MATEQTGGKYRVEQAGQWGTPTAAQGSSYAEDALTLGDGTRLFFRAWQAADTTAPVLVLLHGLGAHSGWFVDMGNELNARGLSVYAPDHRSFGRSQGGRGHVADWRIYPQDTSAFLDEVQRRTPGAPLFVLGHSMGARFTLYVAAEDAKSGGRNRLAGIILMNPWIADTTKLGLGTQLGILFGGMRKSPRTVVYDYDVNNMTTNPEAQAMLASDPNWVKHQSASFLYQVGLGMAGKLLDQAKAVRCPALVLQADADKVVVIKKTRAVYDLLGSQDKTYKTYPGFGHDCEFEPGRAVLDEDIAGWCFARATPSDSASGTASQQ